GVRLAWWPLGSRGFGALSQDADAAQSVQGNRHLARRQQPPIQGASQVHHQTTSRPGPTMKHTDEDVERAAKAIRDVVVLPWPALERAATAALDSLPDPEPREVATVEELEALP